MEDDFSDILISQKVKYLIGSHLSEKKSYGRFNRGKEVSKKNSPGGIKLLCKGAPLPFELTIFKGNQSPS